MMRALGFVDQVRAFNYLINLDTCSDQPHMIKAALAKFISIRQQEHFPGSGGYAGRAAY